MIEQFFQTGGYLIEKQENLYLLGDAILFLYLCCTYSLLRSTLSESLCTLIL